MQVHIEQANAPPEMIPLASPGIPFISEKLFEVKYLSQEALSSGPWQKCFQMLVVFSTRRGARVGSEVGSKVGTNVPFSDGRNTVFEKKKSDWT